MLENLVEYYRKSDEMSKKDLELNRFKKKNQGLQPVPDSYWGPHHCLQGFEKSGHKKRGRKRPLVLSGSSGSPDSYRD